MDEVGSLLNLEDAENDTDSIEKRFAQVIQQKQQAAEKEDYEQAANLRYEEIQLQKQPDKANDEEKVIDVAVSDIQLIVEEKTGIPVTKLQTDEQEKMQNIGENLGAKVIGQEEAVDKVRSEERRVGK